MKLLIIGADGFVGHHILQKSIELSNISVYATYLFKKNWNIPKINSFQLDITNQLEVESLIRQISPDYIIHLAAQSSVALSWSKPLLTVDVNIKGVINILESIRLHSKNSKILLVGSSEEYGNISNKSIAVDEYTDLNPANIYALTKMVQNELGKMYSNAYKLNVLMTRSFNHFGPGQLPTFVISDFCKQIVEIERGIREPYLYVGNLSAERDFTDVRDIVDAYFQLLFKGETGEIYNVGSGKSRSIQSILETIIQIAEIKAEIILDKTKFRPVDIPRITADISKIKKATGWSPKIKFEDSLTETLNYWRIKL